MLNSTRWPKIRGVQFRYFHRLTNTGLLCYAVVCAKLIDNLVEGTSGHQIRMIRLKGSRAPQMKSKVGLNLDLNIAELQAVQICIQIL